MTMKWSGIFLVAVAVLGSLSDAQRKTKPQITIVPTEPPPQIDNSCQVEEYDKIKCGVADISPLECEKINCCHDGQKCYYGKAVTVQCTKDAQFVVVVAKDATVPNIDLQAINFLGGGSGCLPVDRNSAFLVYQFAVTQCGTTVTDMPPGFVIYENRMTSSYDIQDGPRGRITRDSLFELLFQCKYTSTFTGIVTVIIHPLPFPIDATGRGPLDMELRLGNGECFIKGCNELEEAYTSYYTGSDYPVTKVLRDPVYVEVRILRKTDPNIALRLGNCWATSTPDPSGGHQWDLLLDGCPYTQDRYRTQLIPVGPGKLDYPTHYRRFVFFKFTFVDAQSNPLHEKVYIHCNAEVWPSTKPERRCPIPGGRKRRDVAASSSFADSIETTLVSSGEMIFLKDGSKLGLEQSWLKSV